MANTTIQAVREAMRLSQEELALKIREAGTELGEPNDCSQKTVHRWENGSVSYPRRTYVRAIERVLGYPIEQLGFDLVPRYGKLSDHMGVDPGGTVQQVVPNALAADAQTRTLIMPTLTGIWESRCAYQSSSRGHETFTDLANLVVVHAGNQITARSIAGSVTDDGSILMRLELRGRIITGTWEQKTGAESYYRGGVFHGAVQFQVDASGTSMTGAWTGFGREFDVNTGRWQLLRRETGTGKVDEYARVPAREDGS